MRITKISVTKLFGIFNHPVSLNMEDRITIIHGPNGVGKTALLRLIDGFFNSQYSELFSIPFAEFRVDFDDCSHLQITKFFKQTSDNEHHQELTVQLLNRDLEAKIFSPNLSSPDSNDPLKALEAQLKNLELTSKKLELMVKQLGIVIGTGTMPLEDVRKRSDRLRDEDFKIVKQEPNWLSELKHSFHVSFIESQRLLYLSDIPQGWVGWEPPSMISSVDTYSKELAKNIQAKLAEYGALSQSLDRTFPARVVNKKNVYNLTEETLSNKLNEIDQKRSRFIENGLLDIGDNSDFQVPEHIDMTTENILSVYIEDVEKKFSIFNELATKIELFQKIITQRFLYKTIKIDKEKGFTFTTLDGKPLSPTDLSSGEQHELVMLYELLFNVKPNSLILIDEPELSLHVAWQVQFLTDLQAIIKLANFDVLIATHAPGIIEDRWDLTVGLKGQIA
ncbi:AAA family ATPase [Microcoleus sp. A003_D6]|uniref:AAA family ATPase n=1 Tax=Microcoleus sp. A003_D6 TaxID=3055266 RepID=UPI002FD374F2